MSVTVSGLSPATFWSLRWLPSNLTMTTRLLMYCTDMRVSSNLVLGSTAGCMRMNVRFGQFPCCQLNISGLESAGQAEQRS